MRSFRLCLFGAAVLLCSLIPLALGGCGSAGDAARSTALSPAVQAAWPEIRADAELGIQARQDPAFMAAQGGEPIGPNVAESRRERVRQFDLAVEQLRARAP